MASQKVIEHALILWLLSYGVFFGWTVYVLTSPEHLVSLDSQVFSFESTYPAAMNRNKISQYR
jgi:hypothetical protein